MGIGLHSAGKAIAVSPDRVAPKCLAFLKEAFGNFHPRDFLSPSEPPSLNNIFQVLLVKPLHRESGLPLLERT